MSMLPQSIQSTLEEFLKTPIQEVSSVMGGSINQAARLKTQHGDFFLKWNTPGLYPEMFAKEAKGLEALRAAKALPVPEVLTYQESNTAAYLLLPFWAAAAPVKKYWQHFGEGLATLHRQSNDRFGWEEANYMGSLPQPNHYHENFCQFFIQERLVPQVSLAIQKGLLSTSDAHAFEQLYQKLPQLLPEESPALVHGDLWSGNFITTDQGEAGLIDPAVHYGHRESDLAMTKLFGGFQAEFYEAYQNTFPLSPGFNQRYPLYQLYPLLIHVNLFGQGYMGSVKSILKTFA